MYKTLFDYMQTPEDYEVVHNYDNIVTTKDFTYSPLFDGWEIDQSIAKKIIWVLNNATFLLHKKSIVDYFNETPEKTIIAFTVTGDYFDYEKYLRPVFEKQLEYFNKHGYYRNYFAINFNHNISEEFKQEFKNLATFVYWPEFTFTSLIDKFIKEIDVPVTDFNNIDKHFLSLNNRASWDRQSLFYLMNKYDLLDKSYFSYRCQNSDRTRYGDEYYIIDKIIGDPPPWFKDGIDIDYLKTTIPYLLDGYEDSRGISPSTKFISSSFCSIILETHQNNFDPVDTEKILRSFACKRPFLLFSSCGHLKYLQDLGFKTFNDIFDESYDDIENPQLRLEAIFQEILRISNWSIEECQAALYSINHILTHNKNHLKILWNNQSQLIKDYRQLAENIFQTGLKAIGHTV